MECNEANHPMETRSNGVRILKCGGQSLCSVRVSRLPTATSSGSGRGGRKAATKRGGSWLNEAGKYVSYQCL